MITQAQVNQLMKMNASNLPKEILPNYETIKEILDSTDDLEMLNELGLEKEFDTFFLGYNKYVSAPKMTTSSTASQPARKMSSSKPASKPAVKAKGNSPAKPKQTPAEKLVNEGKKRMSGSTPVNSLSKDRQKQNEKILLERSVAAKYELVKKNAKFKANIGEELSKYLKENVVRLGLGGMPIDYEIEQLKAKDKFYTNLLNNDKQDFKIIARRLGLYFRSESNIVTPAKYREKDEKGKPLAAKPKAKQTPDKRTTAQKDSDFWSWFK